MNDLVILLCSCLQQLVLFSTNAASSISSLISEFFAHNQSRKFKYYLGK